MSSTGSAAGRGIEAGYLRSPWTSRALRIDGHAKRGDKSTMDAARGRSSHSAVEDVQEMTGVRDKPGSRGSKRECSEAGRLLENGAHVECWQHRAQGRTAASGGIDG